MRRFMGALILGLGGVVAVAGLILLGAAVSAWIERLEHGSGPMFADAEFLLLLGLAVAAGGLSVLWVAIRLLGPPSGKSGS